MKHLGWKHISRGPGATLCLSAENQAWAVTALFMWLLHTPVSYCCVYRCSPGAGTLVSQHSKPHVLALFHSACLFLVTWRWSRRDALAEWGEPGGRAVTKAGVCFRKAVCHSVLGRWARWGSENMSYLSFDSQYLGQSQTHAGLIY